MPMAVSRLFSRPGFAPLAIECAVHSGDVKRTSGLYRDATATVSTDSIRAVIVLAFGKFALYVFVAISQESSPNRGTPPPRTAPRAPNPPPQNKSTKVDLLEGVCRSTGAFVLVITD